ncbi:hypothetical protein RFI_00728 [Reticulomyxa filosa]|uniref:Peptidase C14 caspase domain-containing protein n=1 Tax=Reticulomyxa filosa TaxID=46433 RepID=X6PDQ6_RETFI|nr:hypothetical protein RFI_00728 [Reticulomyxa filosa]|eukprot:ETO36331.1 hypothetical protein RFI_00728 [Reticulomyxa filosa]
MSSFKAYVNDGTKTHTITLPELTIEYLKRQILQVTRPTYVDDILTAIIDENGSHIKTDESVIRAFEKDPVYFTVQFESSFPLLIKVNFCYRQKLILIKTFQEIIQLWKKKEFEVQSTVPSCKVKYPLVLLVGAIKYEQEYLECVKKDLYLLQALFQSKLGYQVFNTYNAQDLKTETLTLDELDKFMMTHSLSLKDGSNTNNTDNDYDGLIFVWCGHGGFGENEEALITSNGRMKDFKEIQNAFITKTEYFIGKPKIFIKITYREQEELKTIKSNRGNESIRKKIWYNRDADVFSIFVNATKKTMLESPEHCFTEVFCKIFENNMNKDLEFIIKQVIKTVFGQAIDREIIQTVSKLYADIYLIPSMPKQLLLSADSSNDKEVKYERPVIEKDNSIETLSFKRHWNRQWRKANAKAAIVVEQMTRDNKQGLVVVAYDTSKWKNKSDNLALFAALVNNSKDDIKEFGEYCMYVINKKLIILENVNIDGNMYVIDCEIQCKGHVDITTQIFATKNSIIDQHLQQSFSIIQWNTKIHHDIPVQFQDLESKEEEHKKEKLFDESIAYLQKYLQIAIDTFGVNHHYVAIAYNMLALAYDDNKGQPEKAIEFFEKALQIMLDLFEMNCSFVAQLYENIGNTYDKGKNGRKQWNVIQK